MQKQKKMGRNTCLRGRIRDNVSIGEVRKLEGEVRRKQKNCAYQTERGRMGDHASSGERRQLEGEVRRKPRK